MHLSWIIDPASMLWPERSLKISGFIFNSFEDVPVQTFRFQSVKNMLEVGWLSHFSECIWRWSSLQWLENDPNYYQNLIHPIQHHLESAEESYQCDYFHVCGKPTGSQLAGLARGRLTYTHSLQAQLRRMAICMLCEPRSAKTHNWVIHRGHFAHV